MKQLDTIRNHEWIPTEFDLENMPRVTQQLPTASAENFRTVYLLDGTQDGYVKSHFYKCAQDSEGNYYWQDLHVGRFTVGNCRNIRLRMFDDGDQLRIIMAWEDPDDVIVGAEITRWKKTVLVHQVGHMPLTVTDGTIMCTNETRNAYSTFGTFSMTIADTGSRKHYFKLFPYSDDDAITNDDQNGRCAGYNYQITTDVHPYSLADDGTPVYRTYYSRTLNPETNLYVYTELEYNTTNFTLNSTTGLYEFTASKPYYSYQNSLLNWAGIQELVKNGVAEDYFPVGTILMLPYHGDYGQMAFEVVDFDNVEPYDNNIKFTMTLQAKYLYSWWDYYGVGYVFDTNEKPAAQSNDILRNYDKTYFIGVGVAGSGTGTILKGEISSSSALWYDPNKNMTVSAANQGQTGYGTIYVETVFDSYDAAGRDRVGTFDNVANKYLPGMSNTYHTQDGNGPINRFSNTTRTSLMECELPYAHARFQGISVHRAASFDDPRQRIDTNKGDKNTAAAVSAMSNTAELVEANRMCMFRWTGTTGDYSIECWNESTNAAVNITHHFANGAQYCLFDREDDQWEWELRHVPADATNALAAFNNCTNSLASAKQNEGVMVRWEAPTTDYSTGATDSVTTRVGAWDVDTGAVVWEKRTMRYHEMYVLYNDHGRYRWKPHTEFESGPDKDGVEVTYDEGGLCAYFGELYPQSDLHESMKNASGTTRYDDYGCAVAPNAVMRAATSMVDYAHGSYELAEQEAGNRAYDSSHVLDMCISNTACKASAWGPVTFPRDVVGAPRNNYYADRFIPVPKTSNGIRNYVIEAKYFIPVEQFVRKHRSVCAYNQKMKYNTIRSKWMRNASRDVERAVKAISTTGTDTFTTNYYGDFRYQSGNTWYVKFEKVCTDMLRFPSHDDVFMKGKKYWKLTHLPNVDTAVGGVDLLWVWYYRHDGKLPDGSDRWVRALRETAIGLGNDGAVGVMIPVEVVDDVSDIDTTTYEQDGSDSSLYWETIPAGDQLYFNVPYFTAKSISSSNFYANASSVAASSTLYAPKYFKIAQKIIPSNARIPFAFDDNGTIKFTDDGETFYDEHTKDFRGVSPVAMEAATLTGTVSGITYTVKRGYGGTSPTYGTSSNQFSESNTNGYDGYKYTNYYEAVVSSYSTQPAWDGTTVTGRSQCNLFFKQANFERVAYGNHVWAQSNVRAYLNGPFDNSSEYAITTDTKFITTRTYYKFTSGVGYSRLTEAATSGAVDSDHWYKDTSVSAWCENYNGNQPVYVKLNGGIAVGARLDINQPKKFWDYGASPVMQYRYNHSTGTWIKAYPDGYNWWSPMPSVNNGLVYDQLAAMYHEVYIGEGSAGSAVLNIKGSLKNKSPWSNETNVDTSNGWANDVIVAEGNITVSTRRRMPRQSFLHGFIDCQYKRSSDRSPDSSKKYFARNLYGDYQEVTGIGNKSPYANGLYEENPTYKEDIRDAYEFLNAIVPVVNRNGLYGTVGAADLYPHTGSIHPNLGGTLSVDKVWLMSTNQIVGGVSPNNGVYEEWSGAGNGKWITFGVADENRYGLVNQNGHKYGLKKWAMCVNSYTAFGGTSLNDTRIKYSLTLGQHATNGYTDSTLAAQYWWLRSAGGEYPHWPEDCVSTWKWSVMPHALWGPNYWDSYPNPKWLSPLITIG